MASHKMSTWPSTSDLSFVKGITHLSSRDDYFMGRCRFYIKLEEREIRLLSWLYRLRVGLTC